MYRELRRRRPRDERGAIAIVMAASLTVVLIVTALVLDFGLVRVDRQIDRSAADAATLAGLQGLASSGSSSSSPYIGVCNALQFLKANSVRFSGLDVSTGWTNGLGATKASGCTDATVRATKCVPGNQATWAVYSGSVTTAGVTLSVSIRGGYQLAGSGYAEETLPASSSDNADQGQGCLQLATIISQTRQSSFGSLATSSDLGTTIRSVGRARPGPGKDAPAMLLLKRAGCPILQTGGSGGSSFIHVLGALGSNNVAQPGTIHSDSDGTSCTGGSNQNIFLGRAAEGIVAYAAPQPSNPTAADTSKPGLITSVASDNGISGGVIRDSLANAHGSTALNGTTGTQIEPSGRGLVTRASIDDRYLVGVRNAVSAAGTLMGGTPTAAAGWAILSNCKPTQADIDTLSLTATSKLYIACTTNSGVVPNGAVSIPAGTVWFQSQIAPAADVSLPNANHVYIQNVNNKTHAIDLGSSGATFQVNTSSGLDAPPPNGNCTTTQSTSKAVVFVRSGDIGLSTGGTLRLCRTTVMLMGGDNNGCLPATSGTAPTSTPCPSSSGGSGQITQNGGVIDWTAPNQFDVTTLSDGTPDPAMAPAWSDVNGPEDLALWSESYGSSSSTTFSLGGTSTFHLTGVFMVPNADPFTIGGGGTLNLTNAQFIATSISLNGNGTNITMKVDPNSAVHIPNLGTVGLVR